MREIKFRAWHEPTKTMFFVKIITMTSKGVFACFLTDGTSSRDVNPDEICLMQFTGLCDKKGKEGYHKDICKIPGVLVEQPNDIIGVIRWMERAACFYLEYKINKHDRYLSIVLLPEIEIIGDVFQNKDLLKEKP